MEPSIISLTILHTGVKNINSSNFSLATTYIYVCTLPTQWNADISPEHAIIHFIFLT